MKINFPKAITAWLGKGSPEVMEIAPQDDAANAETEPTPESDSVSNIDMGDATINLKADTTDVEAAIARIKAEHKAEMRNSRLELFNLHANTYLALHSAKVEPGEVANLAKGYVGAAMLDAESPVEGFSYLDSFKASVESRKPHGKTDEAIVGDADEVAKHLNAEGLKVLPNAVTTEQDAKRIKDEDARIDALLAMTEQGRAVLAARGNK